MLAQKNHENWYTTVVSSGNNKCYYFKVLQVCGGGVTYSLHRHREWPVVTSITRMSIQMKGYYC